MTGHDETAPADPKPEAIVDTLRYWMDVEALTLGAARGGSRHQAADEGQARFGFAGVFEADHV